MRKAIGAVVLLAGLVALGLSAARGPAPRIEAQVRHGAEAAVTASIHGASVQVSGRDATLAGLVDREAERAALIAALRAVPGLRGVHDTTTLLAAARPFVFQADKTAGGVTYAGNVPSEPVRADLAAQIGGAASGLMLASGAPDAQWPQAVAQGLQALAATESGTLRLEDATLVLTGIVRTPVEEAAALAPLQALPAGYAARPDLTVLDDGKPFSLRVTFDGARAVATGKLPAGGLAQLADQTAALPGFDATGIEVSALPDPAGLWPDFGAAGLAALALTETGTLTVEGDHLTLTAAASPTGKAAAEALLAALTTGVVRHEITLYDDGLPFTLTVDKAPEGALTASGKVPADFDLGPLQAGAPFARAYIADAEGRFAPAATAALAALAQLEQGRVEVLPDTVRLTGAARTPIEAEAAQTALMALPPGTEPVLDLQLLDDGSPPRFTLRYAVTGEARLDGKLPEGLTPEAVSQAIGLSLEGEARAGLVGADQAGPLRDLITLLSGWLAEFDTLTLEVGDAGTTITATATPGRPAEGIRAALAEALGPGVALTVTDAPALPPAGTTRINRATGETETFDGAFWLPQIDFAPGLEACRTTLDRVIAERRIAFLPGSATLDGSSTRALNAMAQVMRRCMAEAGLRAEIGGHTDSQGRDSTNLKLSQDRADAVRAALILRGVPEAALTATGYGESQPIADNATEEGRAANRRTAVTWTE